MENSNVTKVKDLTGLKVGDRLAWSPSNCSDSLYWATIRKITPKGLELEIPDAPSYHNRSVKFAMAEYYKGSGESLLPRGEKHWGSIWCSNSTEFTIEAAVQASYDERAAYAAKQKADGEIAEQKRQERIAAEKAEAYAANPDVAFTEIGTMGTVRYFSAHILDSRERMCFVVVAAMRCKESNYRDDTIKMVWKAAINYNEPMDPQYGPRSMGSRSDVQADTLYALFQAVIYRMW